MILLTWCFWGLEFSFSICCWSRCDKDLRQIPMISFRKDTALYIVGTISNLSRPTFPKFSNQAHLLAGVDLTSHAWFWTGQYICPYSYLSAPLLYFWCLCNSLTYTNVSEVKLFGDSLKYAFVFQYIYDFRVSRTISSKGFFLGFSP